MVPGGLSARAGLALLAILGTAAMACDPAVGRTFEPGVEHLPTPGSIHVEGRPRTAERPLTVRFVGSDGERSAVAEAFAVGDVVRIDRTDFPGIHALTVNGVACDGPFAIEAQQETDLILRITRDGCETIVERTHDEAAVVHEEVVGRLFGRASIRAPVIVSSLDDTPRHAPVAVTADESGWFEVDGLPPGRYRVDVRAGTATISATVELGVGESVFLDLTRPAASESVKS
jgi:hypothetical protein